MSGAVWADAATDPYASRIGIEPERVPREDPVVFSQRGAPSPLSASQVARYEADGFLAIDGLLSATEIEALQAELARLRADRSGLDPETLVCEPASDELRSIFRIHAQSALVGRLVRAERLVGIARYLLGDEVYVHQSRLNHKPGFAGKEFYWHSDFETWHVEDGMPRMRALSVSIALTANREYNGPLMLVPGSHLEYVRCVGVTPDEHYKCSLRRQEYGVPDRDSVRRACERGGIAVPKGPAGRIVLFDCNVLHGSNGNISPEPRSNLFFVYNSVTNQVRAPYGGKPPRPEFVATRRDVRAIRALRGALA